MNIAIHHRLSALLATTLLSVMALASCDNNTAGPDPNGNKPVDTASVLLKFTINTTAGTAPFVLDSTYTSEAGAQYKVSKLLYYVNSLRLIDSAGNDVPVALLDADNKPILYNTMLVDYRRPETMELRVLAKRGGYKGVRLLIGIPRFDAGGNMLNHIDASTMEYPLNVDADMYWGWKVGYVFLKIEGKSLTTGGQWSSFFYHVGDDPRLMSMDLQTPFTVKGDGSTVRTLAVDVNRMFITQSGEHRPNPAGTQEERIAHGGTTADLVATNVMNSGFITLK